MPDDHELDDGDVPDAAGHLVRPSPPRTWRERIEHLADATGTSPARLGAGAVLAVMAIGAALWLTRPPRPPAELSIPYASTSLGATRASGTGGARASSSLPPTSTSAAPVVVDVEGAVLQPGVHRLEPGARVTDAIAAAGGLRPDADGARLNLAAVLHDGERVYVPLVGEDPPPVVGPGGGAPAGGPGAGAPSGPVDLNSADAAALDALPGVGPATAAAIIAHREEIGRYTSVDQLLDVRGIGEAKLAQLRPLVTV